MNPQSQFKLPPLPVPLSERGQAILDEWKEDCTNVDTWGEWFKYLCAHGPMIDDRFNEPYGHVWWADANNKRIYCKEARTHTTSVSVGPVFDKIKDECDNPLIAEHNNEP